MKILIIGSTHPASYESSCARYFREAGCEVCFWDNKGPLISGFPKNWWQLGPVARRAYNVAASLAFVRHVEKHRPEVVFMPKAENLHHRAIQEAKERSKARLVVWYPDNPFRAENTSIHILRNLERCDLFYIWGKFLIEPLRSAGCRRVEYLPFAFDPVLHPSLEGKRGGMQRIPVLHVGSYSEEKRDALIPLAGSGLEIWGPGWETEMRRKGPLAACVKGSGLYGKEMAEAYGRALVVANPIRLQNMPAHNLRTMEVAGIGGGVVLTQRTEEQSVELFAENEQLLCYASEGEMKEKCLWSAEHPEECAVMALEARKRVLECHLLKHRIEQILADLVRL